MLKRLFHFGPDVASLLERKDVPGLVRALQHKSPEVVTGAAEAIVTLHREGGEAEREKAAGTAAALMGAYTDWSGAWPRTTA